MGLLLQLLDQGSELDSLQWFDSVRSHFAAEARQHEEALGRSARGGVGQWLASWTGKGSEQQTAARTQNTELLLVRSQAYAAEFGLLADTFACCRTLIRGV